MQISVLFIDARQIEPYLIVFSILGKNILVLDMASINQIELQAIEMGGPIISACEMCFQQAWSDYYGNYACKNCLQFFLDAVKNRRDYKCDTAGKCGRGFKTGCKYCMLNAMFLLDFKPIRVGRHDISWYMKDNIPNIKKVPIEDPLTITTRGELKMFQKYCGEKLVVYKTWIKNNPPKPSLTENELNKLVEKYEDRCIVMKIAKESLPIHDVLRLKHQFFDPFKCSHPQLQYLTIAILKFIRMIRDLLVDKDEIPIDLEKVLIYSSGPLKVKNSNYVHLHEKLAEITAWMKTLKF